MVNRASPLIDRLMYRQRAMENGCIEWTGAKSRAGYGQIGDGGKVLYTHRLSYEMRYGPIPEGMVLDHLCRNRSCCNPEHLEAVSRGENVRRAPAEMMDRNSSKTTCKRGHPLEGENLYINPKGQRQCQTCKTNRRRERAAETGRPMSCF